jgi:hypothetical protein
MVVLAQAGLSAQPINLCFASSLSNDQSGQMLTALFRLYSRGLPE